MPRLAAVKSLRRSSWIMQLLPFDLRQEVDYVCLLARDMHRRRRWHMSGLCRSKSFDPRGYFGTIRCDALCHLILTLSQHLGTQQVAWWPVCSICYGQCGPMQQLDPRPTIQTYIDSVRSWLCSYSLCHTKPHSQYVVLRRLMRRRLRGPSRFGHTPSTRSKAFCRLLMQVRDTSFDAAPRAVRLGAVMASCLFLNSLPSAAPMSTAH